MSLNPIKNLSSGLWPEITALAAGAAAVFAFAPFDLWWLLPLAYGALFFIIYLSSPARAFLRGLLFGAGHFGLGLHWIFAVMEQHRDIHHRMAMTLIILGVIFCLCLFPAFVALLSSLIPKNKRKSPLWWLLLAPSLFCLSEWSRGWALTGFPYFYAGDAMPPALFSGLFPVAGALGVGFCFYLTVGCLGWLSLNPRKSGVGIAAALIIALTSASLFLENVVGTYPLPQKAFDAQLIRGNIGLDQKNSRPAVVDRVRLYQAWASLEPRPLLSVWPESSVSVNYSRVKNRVEKGFKDLAAQGTEVFFGAYRLREGRSVNIIIRGSDQKTVYSKQHLLPFGEYSPAWIRFFKDWLPKIDMGELAAGNQTRKLIDFKGLKIAPSICFEILFGEELRQAAAEADLHTHVSDLGWFKDTWAVHYLLRAAQTRAMESAKPMIYSVNQGKSAFINHKGKIIKSSSAKGAPFIYNRIIPRRGATWHGRLGCAPLIVLCFLTTLLAFWRLRRPLTGSRSLFGAAFRIFAVRDLILRKKNHEN